jgi:hypothetical protein
MQIFLPKDRKYDAGIELGTGYSIAGGPTYGMTGAYFQYGLTGEYLVAPVFGLTLNVRHFNQFWNKFYTDFDNNIGGRATSPGGGFTTVTVGISLHLPVPVETKKKEKKADEK